MSKKYLIRVKRPFAMFIHFMGCNLYKKLIARDMPTVSQTSGLGEIKSTEKGTAAY